MSVPDSIHRVAGARSWRIANTMWARLGGLLWADAMLEPWPKGKEYEATCSLTRIPHEIPGELCHCGVWAWYAPDRLFKHWYGYNPENRSVTGIVSGAGVMWLHDFGWRAARARVEAIFLDDIPEDELPTTKQEISEAYNVPIIAPEEYQEFCKDRGIVVFSGPDEIL